MRVVLQEGVVCGIEVDNKKQRDERGRKGGIRSRKTSSKRIRGKMNEGQE